MYAKHKTPSLPCVPGALPGGLSRTRFFDGMLLTQLDLEREQNYWRTKRKLTNRALGIGVVWGLRLEWDERTHCFHLGPGYALDCCGNDLVVECPQHITEQSLIDKNDPAIQAILAGQQPGKLKCPEPEQEQFPKKACIILQYTECAGDPQPVHDDACTTNVAYCEYSSIRETTRVLLVPPPAAPEPTPIDNFCKRVDELKQACVEAGGNCGLFDQSTDLSLAEFPLIVKAINKTTGDAVILQPTGNPENPAVTLPFNAPGAVSDLDIWIEPAPGCVFEQGEVNGAGVVELQLPPFGEKLEITDAAFLTGVVKVTVSDLRIVSLLNNETHISAGMELSLGTDAATGDRFIQAQTMAFAHLPAIKSCNDKLKPLLFFNGDPQCIGKTLLLAVLCSYFKGMLGSSTATSGTTPTVGGKHLLAWWVCYVAWKILFDANLDDEEGELLSNLLKNLLDEWCTAFTYPGPYCTDDHHGVYLGCVELSAKGNIISFDPWAHRRHVITGPLLTHWGSLMGLAPIDVVVSRFASWICCVGDAPLAGIPTDLGASLMDSIALDEYGLSIVLGDEAALNAHLEKRELQMVGEIKQMDFATLVKEVLNNMTQDKDNESAKLLRGRRIYSVIDRELFLLVPSRELLVRPDREHAGVASSVAEYTHSLRPLAKAIVQDYATEVAGEIELSRLNIVNDDATMQPFVEILAESNIKTIASFVDLGAERAAHIVINRADDVSEYEDKEVVFGIAEELTINSEAVIKTMVEPFVEIASEADSGPFLVERLTDENVIKKVGSSVRKNLKGSRSITSTVLKKIGERVVERRNQMFNKSRD